MRIMTDRKRIKINNALITLLILSTMVTLAIFVVNIIHVNSMDTGEGSTIEKEETSNEFENAQYKIGNNPTVVNKDYFKELNTALETQESTEIAQSVTKCFISEYYTWTNKDGNYDIGGMQYIFTPKKDDFATYSLWNFYEDMDLYITQYGNENLIQVKEVTVNSATAVEDYTVQIPGDESEVADGSAEATTEVLPCVDVNASWTYENDTAGFQTQAVFHVVNNNGRWEIAGITA